jgi:hypothetical protein
MALDANDALTQLVIFAGVVIGSVAWTMWQYLKTKAKFDDFDIQILFDKKFVGTAVGAIITSFVLVSGSFNSFLDKVLTQDPVTFVAAFFAAFGLGFTFNAVGNQLIPSPNKEAEKQMQDKMVARALTLRGIDLEKLSNITDGVEESGKPTVLD